MVLKLEKTFMVSVRISKPTDTASVTGVSRKSCTRTIFPHHDPYKGLLSLPGDSLHLLPFSEFGPHLCSRSERTSMGWSVSELRSDKAQNSAIKSTLGHRSASSSRYKRDSVSLLGGYSTSNIPFTTASSPPSCATVLHPDEVVFLSSTASTGLPKLRPDVLRSRAASHPGARISPAMLDDNGPNVNCLWAWPITIIEESNHLFSQSILSRACTNERQLTTGLITLTSLKISEGFLGIYIMRVLFYHSYRMNCSVDSSTSSIKERSLLPCLFSVKGDDSSGLLSRICFNLLTGLPPCVAVCTGPEGAIKTTSFVLVGESRLSTSQHKVTKFQQFDFVVHASSTHSSLVLISLSSSYEKLSCLILFAIVAYVYFPRGCLIPSSDCSSSS